MGICSQLFDGEWDVEYRDEPEFRGKLFIRVELEELKSLVKSIRMVS